MKKMQFQLAVACAFGLAVSLSAGATRADEGMWTFNNFPKQTLKEKHGVAVDDKWLDHVRLSSARLAQGCSASFVSADGLVLTNHHCAHSCIEQLSTPERDLVKNGYTAKTEPDELKCPEMEVNQLAEITDVTERVRKATAGLSDQKYNEAEKAELSRIEKECATSPEVRCDVVTLYRGGVYNLYKYRRFQDVRLVFAPEFAIAFFGGDPDNFNFPRYDLDVSFLRVYQDGKPAALDHHLAWSPTGRQGRRRHLRVRSPRRDRSPVDGRAARVPARRHPARPPVAPGRAARLPDRIPAPRRRTEADRQPRAVLGREQPQGAARTARRLAGQRVLRPAAWARTKPAPRGQRQSGMAKAIRRRLGRDQPRAGGAAGVAQTLRLRRGRAGVHE